MVLTNGQTWGLRIGFVILFVLINLGVWALRNKPKLSYAIAWCIAAYLFVYKVGEYVWHQCAGHHMSFPLEFSALSYVAFAVLTLFGSRKGDAFGSFTAILAGGIYVMSWWISPGSHLKGGINYFEIMAILNHHALYIGGILIAANCRRYSLKTLWQVLFGVGLFVAYSWTICSTTNYIEEMGSPIIIRITTGEIVYQIRDTLTPAFLALYYVFAIGLLVAIIAGFYVLNMWQAKRRIKCGLPADYYARGLSIFGVGRNPYDPYLDAPMEPAD